jgi:hypothetical protein
MGHAVRNNPFQAFAQSPLEVENVRRKQSGYANAVNAYTTYRFKSQDPSNLFQATDNQQVKQEQVAPTDHKTSSFVKALLFVKNSFELSGRALFKATLCFTFYAFASLRSISLGPTIEKNLTKQSEEMPASTPAPRMNFATQIPVHQDQQEDLENFADKWLN